MPLKKSQRSLKKWTGQDWTWTRLGWPGLDWTWTRLDWIWTWTGFD